MSLERPMRPLWYRLIGRVAVPCNDVRLAGEQLGDLEPRIVGKTYVGVLEISTVFIVLDHSFGKGPPLIFETVIFDDDDDGYRTRSSTWEQAEEQHQIAVAVAVEKVRAADAGTKLNLRQAAQAVVKSVEDIGARRETPGPGDPMKGSRDDGPARGDP
jgi:hypothetical protein